MNFRDEKDGEKDDRIEIIRRLLAQIQIGKEKGECWFWIGPTISKPGGNPYGYLYIHGKLRSARRMSYLYLGNFFDLEEKTVRSICGNSLCCNPEHLKKGKGTKSNGPRRSSFS